MTKWLHKIMEHIRLKAYYCECIKCRNHRGYAALAGNYCYLFEKDEKKDN